MSVVLPVHNEAATLAGTVAELARVLGGRYGDWELVIVDDGSTDAGLDGLARDGLRIRVIRLPEQRGSGYARRLGSREAGGEVVVWMDADGTYAPADIPPMVLELLASGAHQVVGARPCDHGLFALGRFAAKKVTAWACSLLWGTSIPDHNSGLRVFCRASMEAWLDLVPPGFSCTTTATLGALNAGQKVRFVPVNYLPRAPGSESKFHPLWDSWRLCVTVARLWNSRRIQG